MKDLNKITIVFENCDLITLKKDQLFNFHADGITEQIWLCSNAIVYNKVAQKVRLSLKIDKITNENVSQLTDIPLIERLKSKDITSYTLHMDDNTEYELLVPWKGDSEYVNAGEYHEIIDNIIHIEHY